MYKLKTSILLTSLLLAANSFAGKQTVKLCLDVTNDLESQSFSGEFISTDVFDQPRKTGRINDGVGCVWHNYGFGPKNISLSIYPERSPYKVRFHLNNCPFLHTVGKKTILKSGVLRSEASAITYNVSIKKTQQNQGDFKSYTISCSQSTS